MFFFFKQKTAYEMRISDWSSDVCSSDLQSGWFVGNFLSSFGSYHVTEAYLELLVPVIEGLDLNGAVRGTDYSTSGYVTTWKAGLTFEPIPDISIRATRSRDIRAPNLGELFTAGSTRINVLIDPTQNNASVQVAGKNGRAHVGTTVTQAH